MAIDPYLLHRPSIRRFGWILVFLCYLTLQSIPAVASLFTSPQLAEPPAESFNSINPSLAVQPSIEKPPGALVDPNEMVLKAVHEAVWGPAFSCRVQQKTFYGNRTTTAQGQYLQAGNGTCQLKFQLRLGIGKELQTIFQVSDGRMLWTSMGEDQPYRTVNVGSVRAEVAPFGRRLQEVPEAALYLAIGGQAEVLRSLYMHYRWHKAYAVSLDDVPVWQLIGTLRTEPPRIRAEAQCDQLLKIAPSMILPQDVRLTLSRDSARKLFPYRVEYFTRKPNKEGKREDHIPFSTLEYFELNEELVLADDTFRTTLQENIHGREDETKRYLMVVKP